MDSGACSPRHRSTPPGPVQTTEQDTERRGSFEVHDHENDNDNHGPQLQVSTAEARQDPKDDASPPPSSPPPFWTGRSRPVSYQSITQIQRRQSGGPIQLEDHSEEDHVQAQFCWAESATIDAYVIVSGPTGIGAYVVWHCTVKTLKGGDLEIRKRYSEFATLRNNLVRSFPHADNMIPELPRKSVVSRFRPRFLEARKRGLSHFLNCILLNPEFASSPVLKEFVFN